MLDKSLIRHLDLFASMSEQGLDEVLSGATSRHLPEGTVVFEQGRIADQFFVLLHGRLRVTQVSASGQQTIVRMVNPGDLFGIARALRREDYPGTATAVVDSIALAWPMDRWDKLLPVNPALAINAMQTIGQRLQEAHARIQELATEQVERRVAHAVLRLVETAGRAEEDGVLIDFPLSKQDLAEMTGTTLYTVSRILTGWEQAGIVVSGRQRLLVRDQDQLRQIGAGVPTAPKR